jgi:flagellar biosynthesis component FlhA
VSDEPREPSREELAAALATNAASRPLNLAVLAVVFVVALVVGAPLIVALLVAFVLYTAAVARTMFDAGEAERVAARRRTPPPR